MLQRYRINNCADIAEDGGGYCLSEDVAELEKSKWVSVVDELPTKGDYYLVTDGEVVFQLGYSIAGLWTSDDGNPEPINGITHWQPLPPPPQQPTGKG